MCSTAALGRGLTSLCCSCPSLRTSTLPATLRSRSNQVCQSPPPYGSTLTMRKSDLMLLETGFSLRQGLQGKHTLACSAHNHALKQALQQEESTALCTSCIIVGAGRHHVPVEGLQGRATTRLLRIVWLYCGVNKIVGKGGLVWQMHSAYPPAVCDCGDCKAGHTKLECASSCRAAPGIAIPSSHTVVHRRSTPAHLSVWAPIM